jgi:hypothetical protein
MSLHESIGDPLALGLGKQTATGTED